MPDPNSPWGPPIPPPDGSRPTPGPGSYQPYRASVDRSSFKNAPAAVRSARFLTVLGTAGALFLIFFGFMVSGDRNANGLGMGMIALATLGLGLNVWLHFALTKGTKAAWTAQIVVSILTIISLPRIVLLLIAHAYLLSQWFKDETKAWFDVA